MRFQTGVFAVVLLMSGLVQAADWKTDLTLALKNGGALVEDAKGNILFAYRENDGFIPASVLKLATAAAAIKNLSLDYHFRTDFFTMPTGDLVVRGYGDPLIDSDEIQLMVEELQQQGLKTVGAIILDDTFFESPMIIDGVEKSSNPYDALNAALYANFNNVGVRKFKNGKIISADRNTPLTPLMQEKIKTLRRAGFYRINLGRDRKEPARYFGELLRYFLEKAHISVTGQIQVKEKPSTAQFLLSYKSSKSMEDILEGLLKFSNNLTTNQLFLVMGAQAYGAPATVGKGVRVLSEFLEKEVGWKDFHIEEASGLSKKNRVTPSEILALLRYFEPYQELLPIKEHTYRAKTGTLNGVSSLAGYMPTEHDGLVRFALFVNDKVAYAYKYKVGKMLYNALNPAHPLPIK